MKKTITLLLALIMVLTLVSGILPRANAADYESKPFFGLGWSDIDRETFENGEGLPTVGVRFNADGNLEVYKDNRALGTDEDKLAQWVKEQMEALPVGSRYLHVYAVLRIAAYNPIGVVDMSPGFDKAKPVLERFFKKLHDLGVPLDGLVFDCEYMRMRYFEIYTQEVRGNGNNLVYQQIVDTDRYKNVIRPMLEERGFKFWPEDQITEYTPEIYGIYPHSGDEYEVSREIWNRVMRILLNRYLDESIYEPAKKYYPDLHASDYQSHDSYTWYKELTASGTPDYNAGNNEKVGDTSNMNTYNYRPGAAFFTSHGETVYKNPIGYNDAVYPEQPFYMFMYDINQFKNIMAATEDNRISTWIGSYDYNDDNTGSASNSPYYTETVYHLGLQDPDPFLIWIYDGYYATKTEYNKRIQVVSEIMDELTKVAGYSDRKPIAIASDWNSKYVLSGIYAGGRNVFRLTPDTGVISLEDFKVEGATDPTFYVNGKTITFPGGKIIEDGEISQVGSCGYWIETAADVMPVVTVDTDRYSEYPSFGEDFESYKVGGEFSYTTAKPVTAWEFKKSKNSSILIQEKDGDQVLAITGDVTVQSVKMPQNISAADNYAKQQVWEVKVTLPKDMAAEAEVVLLSCSRDDKGVKIVGGNVYYDQAGEYQQMKGVTLAADTEYLIRREVDFRAEGAYTCDYYIFDASGKLLGSVKDVPMTAKLELPVETISVVVTDNFDGNTVLLDDFKLYPTGVTKDFEIYNAASGLLVKETDSKREEAAAYRLSWMNASDKAETVAVIAEFYDGNRRVGREVIKELIMEPGSDGVETGIVEIKKGTSVKVFLGDAKDTSALDPTVIVVIAVAVVAVALVAGVVLLRKKKPTVEAAAPAEDAESEAEAVAEEAAVAEATEETPSEDEEE